VLGTTLVFFPVWRFLIRDKEATSERDLCIDGLKGQSMTLSGRKRRKKGSELLFVFSTENCASRWVNDVIGPRPCTPSSSRSRIKMVEPIKITTPAEREAILRRAHFNAFQIPAEEVMIDLLTDSGTAAMSAEQWAGMLRGDESYAGARSWYRFEAVLRELTGMPHILPTHQGRASERILFELMGGPDKVIPNNNHFDTTRANIEHSRATAIDLVIDEGTQPRSRHPFKGNLDVVKLETLIAEVGAARIPLCMVTVTKQQRRGQPVSLANLRAVRDVCHAMASRYFSTPAIRGKRLFHQAARAGPGEPDRPGHLPAPCSTLLMARRHRA